MAWSDAARAAALEARRNHASVKRTVKAYDTAYKKAYANHVPGRATLGNRVHNLYGPSAKQVKAGIPTTARFNRLGRRVK